MKTIIIGSKEQSERIILLVKRFYNVKTENILFDPNIAGLLRLNNLDKLKACVFDMENIENSNALRKEKEKSIFLHVDHRWFYESILTDLTFMNKLDSFLKTKNVNCLVSMSVKGSADYYSRLKLALDNFTFVPFISKDDFSSMSRVKFENMFFDENNGDFAKKMVKAHG